MHKTKLSAAVAVALLVAAPAVAHGPARSQSISLVPIASVYTSEVPAEDEDTTAAEVVAYDARTQRAFAINSTENTLAIVDLAPLRNGGSPVVLNRISFGAYGAGLNGVAVHDGWVAVAVQSDPKTDPGKVVLFRAGANDLARAHSFTVGALPDMVTFTNDGEYLLVANEGEPNSYGAADSVNPEGSVSIIDLRRGPRHARVSTASFARFNSQIDALRAQGVRIFGPGASVAQDLEPEYITTRGRFAWVTLQEANALAVVDIPTATVLRVVPLGTKDHRLSGNALDSSDRDNAINIVNRPIRGLYQPDAIANFRGLDGQIYLVTANEGDSRSGDDFPGFNEEVRLSTIPQGQLPAEVAAQRGSAALGRLNVTLESPKDASGNYTAIDVFGARSFSVWSASGDLVWDSGDEFERYFAANAPTLFNASNANPPEVDNRSDNKGPEPEGVAIGRIGWRTYAFIGLERVGGVFAYDVTDPAAPTFAAYANARDVDLGPEGVTFVGADDSPTCSPLVLVGNEVSRTLAVYEVEVERGHRGKRDGDRCGRDRH
jgi:hypothetical protein